MSKIVTKVTVMVSLRSWLDFLSAVIHIYTSASSSDEPAIINNNTGNHDGNTKTSNNNILYTYYSYISIFKEIIFQQYYMNTAKVYIMKHNAADLFLKLY